MIPAGGGQGTRLVARRSSTRRDRFTRAIASFLATAVVGAVLWYINVLRFDLTVAVVIALLVGAVVTLLSWVMSEESVRLKPAYWFASMREESVRPAALDYRMLRLRRDLRDATERSDRTDEIYSVIRSLAAERLMANHGIDLDADPDGAAAMMHADLIKYLSKPPTGTAKRSKRDIARALDRIEEL
ncbi:hypothetical protein MWU75_05295 [Ornithinimicrobium sp. F0845]|uniref:hypothetical protein n=1 Tax=Ornithinimicrobium sp. F0845 TaxID=2926412 RepID=UPI001FF532C6|nr:hypothetical protein [Ornithinimicrobium sp. F0845]MCK0111552.1 hypothetical protein [Ornithinimicrobium sp. F0845]